jgi:DNA polymerase
MSQSARSTVFLQEMGIGVQWKLRNGEVAADGFAAAVQALADGEPAEEAPAARQLCRSRSAAGRTATPHRRRPRAAGRSAPAAMPLRPAAPRGRRFDGVV